MKKSIHIINLLLLVILLLSSCQSKDGSDDITKTYIPIDSINTSNPNLNDGSASFENIIADTLGYEKLIKKAEYETSKKIVHKADRIVFLNAVYGTKLLSRNLDGSDPMTLYSVDTQENGLFNLQQIENEIYFIMDNVGIYTLDGNFNPGIVLKGKIEDYIINNTILYCSMIETTANSAELVLKSYDLVSKETKKIGLLSKDSQEAGLLEVSGNIYGIDENDLLYYSQRDEYKNLTYHSYNTKTFKTENLNKQMFEDLINQINPKSECEIKVDLSDMEGANKLVLKDFKNNKSHVLAHTRGDSIYIAENNIYILDVDSNIEHIGF